MNKFIRPKKETNENITSSKVPSLEVYVKSCRNYLKHQLLIYKNHKTQNHKIT